MTFIFDLLFSEWLGAPFGFGLPKYPAWMCGLLTDHKVDLEWADYGADVKGTRCRCGQKETER